MENQTLVRSYVRGNKSASNEVEQIDPVVKVITGTIALSLAVVYWQLLIVALPVTAAVYGVKLLNESKAPVEVTEAVTQPVQAPKTKRHYQHRLKVRHYQSNKVVRV
jgi:hypothetical protein